MSKDREYDEKMGLSRAGRDATDSYSESKLRRNATGDSPSEMKLRQNAKPRSKSSDTRNMNPMYKPKASPGPVSQLGTYQTGKKGLEQRGTYQTGQGLSVKKTYQTGSGVKEVYKSKAASASKTKAKAKDTSFKKSGVAGVLKSPEAKKFRDTFRKKGLLPALRGK
jgi:hypothetical protein